jgi:AraC-like DNA-binding protein/ligand-binding sensor protein
MNLEPVAASESTTPAGGPERALVHQIEKAQIFQDYREAFETTTGLPLVLRQAGSAGSPMSGSKRRNPFCGLMARTNASCAACVQMQQGLETAATHEPKTLECFAGLTESAVPVRVGETLVGYLRTGQVFLAPPTLTRFREIARWLGRSGPEIERLRVAYFRTRVVEKTHYESAIRLLGIFSQHLAVVSNQLMIGRGTAEFPRITRARAFIAEHQGEDIHFHEVAQAVSMSPFYFCKLFKASTGLSFTRYLARVRVEAVQALLLNTHIHVTEAAYAVGFQSLSQFNRVFRRVAGESPTVFRERRHSLSLPAFAPGG